MADSPKAPKADSQKQNNKGKKKKKTNAGDDDEENEVEIIPLDETGASASRVFGGGNIAVEV